MTNGVGEVNEITTSREKRRRSRPRGYVTWNPHRHVRVLLGQVQSVLDEYERHLPLTIRQVFYRLVAAYGYEKTEPAYNRLCEHLVTARRARMIPFESIRDDGIVTYSARWHQDVQGFWDDTGRRIRDYRRDRQAGQPVRIELWCEAAGMAPQLSRVADDYSVEVFSTGGFAGLCAVRMIVDRALERTTPTVFLHCGDLDPSGEAIFKAMTEDAIAFLEADQRIGTQRIIPVRVALTRSQVEAFALPTAPPKKSDSRSASWEGGTCQLEALAPDTLATIVREAIEEHLDGTTFTHQLQLERADVAELWKGLPRGSA
jgi:hypothetical protein